MAKMHENEVETSESLVRDLLAAQFAAWKDLPIAPILSTGTGNAIYRLGDDKVVRLPRIPSVVEQVEKEHAWLANLAGHLPVAIPEPIVKGEPHGAYPFPWSVYRWIEGENLTFAQLADPGATARELAAFVNALNKVETTGWPRPLPVNTRGYPLKQKDGAVREAIHAMRDSFDADALTAFWEDALEAPDWDQNSVWFHGDLLVGNILFNAGRISAIIDFGSLGVGDPACDLMIAWNLLEGESRQKFREALDLGDATWKRGRAHAFAQALIYIPYYLHSNPVGVAHARRALYEVLTDFRDQG